MCEGSDTQVITIHSRPREPTTRPRDRKTGGGSVQPPAPSEPNSSARRHLRRFQQRVQIERQRLLDFNSSVIQALYQEKLLEKTILARAFGRWTRRTQDEFGRLGRDDLEHSSIDTRHASAIHAIQPRARPPRQRPLAAMFTNQLRGVKP